MSIKIELSNIEDYDGPEDILQKVRKAYPDLSYENAMVAASRILAVRDGRVVKVEPPKPGPSDVVYRQGEDIVELCDRIKVARPWLDFGECQVEAQRLKTACEREIKSIKLREMPDEGAGFDGEVTALTSRGVPFDKAQVEVQTRRTKAKKAEQLTYLRANRHLSLDQLCNVLERKFGMHYREAPGRADWLMSEVQDEPIRLTAEEEAYVRTAEKNRQLAAHAMKLLDR